MKTQASPKQNFVVINGRRVSADSGKSLDGPSKSARRISHNLDLRPAHKKNAGTMKSAGKAQTLDGFRKVNTATSNRKRHVKQTRATQVHKRATTTSPNTKRSHSTKSEPKQTSQAPKEPQVTKRNSIRNQQRASRADIQTAHLTQARAERSTLHRQHNQVSRFGSLHNYENQQNDDQVQAEPKQHFKVAPLSADLGHVIAEHNVNNTPSDERQQQEPAITPERKNVLRNLLTTRRTISYAATAMVLIVIAGYTAYLNAANVSMRVAAARSGVEAQMPDYQPSGFAQTGAIEYGQGQVVVSFSSNTDSRSFNITQRNSQWDSASLLANYVQPVSDEYDIIEEGGLKIYVFKGSNAAWVNKGIWYTIEGESLMSAQQIASIATSF